MSQVRKLLKGQNIPKAEAGYKFQLDSQIYDVTDEQLKEIDDAISKLDIQHRRFLANWTNAIKSGESSGNRANNTVTMNMISGVDGRDIDRLKRKKGSFWETFAGKDSYYAKEAINEALNITASVLNRSTTQNPNNKTVRYNRAANFDYDTIDGKQVYSSNPKNRFIEDRFAAYLDWLSNDKWGDLNEWETSLGDNEAILRSWYNSLGDRAKAQAAIDAAMTEVRSKPWDEVSEATKELLAYFNIGNGSDTTSPSGESTGSSENTPPLDENGNIDTSARTENGAFRVWYGTGNDRDKLFTNSTVGNNKPYLLNADRLPLYGLGEDYLNGLIYQGRIYKPDEVSKNIQLQNIMNQVVTENNSAHNTEDVWNKVGALIDFTDNPNHYISYDSDLHYIPYEYRELRNLLGSGRYSLADISNVYDTGGNRLFEIYDFNTNGTNQWGFRAPQYYISNVGSLLSYIPEGYTFLNRNWSPTNSYSNWETINGNQYGLVGNFWGADAHDTIPYQIFEDRSGNFWGRKGNGEMRPLDAELVEWILQGNKPNHNQMWYGNIIGDASIKAKQRKEAARSTLVDGRFTTRASFKEGGKVQLKPLPVKLQMGSRLSVAPNQPESIVINNDTPLAHASNIWETLTPADQKEIAAAAIDVAGAIAGLVPGGSIAGAVAGIGASTPLMMSAAKERKGHLDAGDWGQAVVATGLDLVSLIPYLGETGKIVKVGKAVTKVAPVLGKAFNALGLMGAASVLTKNPKDWSTDDLLALSAGIQSIVNIGHGLHIRRGESRLASKISNMTKGETSSEKPYSRKFKAGKNNDVDIPLDRDDVKSIIESKTPGEKLKEILKGYGVSDDQLTDMRQLLKDYGFDVGRKLAWNKNKRVTASQPEPETSPEYTKYGYLFDEVLDPLGRRERARRTFIDEKLRDSKIREQLASDVFDTNKQVINNPREIITRSSYTPKNTPEARAYIQSLARLGQAETSWVATPKVKSQETIAIDRTPGVKADAEAAIARGEGLPSTSEMVRSAGKLGLDSINEFAAATSDINAGVSKAMGPKPTATESRARRLGAESVSNKELIDYINDKELSYSEAVQFVLSLSERKRNSLLNAISKPGTGSRAKRIRREYLKARGIADVFDRANTEDFSARLFTSESVKQGNARKAFDSARKIASNLVQLRESKDPMKTLSLLSRREGFDQWVYDHPEEFREALEYAKSHGIYSRLTKKQKRQYDFELSQLIDARNLIFKKGGVIKAQNGTPTVVGTRNQDGKYYISSKINDEVTEEELTGPLAKDLYNFWTAHIGEDEQSLNTNWEAFKSQHSYRLDSPLRAYMRLDENFSNPRGTNTPPPSELVGVPSQTSSGLDDGGGPNYNLTDYSKYLLPALSLGRFALTSRFQNKYYKQAVDALNAGRVDKQAVRLNAPRIDNPSLDRALQQIQSERMIGIKPVTSDLVMNNALQNQREAQLYNRERDIVGQRSAFDWDAKNRVLEIENQNRANEIETTNDNAMRRAAINSAIKQQAMELTQRRSQSWENLGLELQNNLKKDRNIMLDFNKTQEQARLQKIYDDNLNRLFGAEARNKYRALSVDQAMKYADFEDYLRREYTDVYNKHIDQIENWQKDMINGMRKWMYSNALNYSYPEFLTGKVSTVGIWRNGGIMKAQEGSELLRPVHPHQVIKRVETRSDGSIVGIIEEINNLGQITTQEVLLQEPVGTNSTETSNTSSETTSNDKSSDKAQYKLSEASKFSDFVPVDFNNWTRDLKSRSIVPVSALPEEYLPELYNKKKDYTDLVNILEQLTSRYKKGGYLRGSTRYTKEPDEQIWIDNNKATHRAIAKLNDNTIKLLLRALK